MSEGKAVQDRSAGRGITHWEDGGSILVAAKRRKMGKPGRARFASKVLDGLGRHDPKTK
jgi:hypothetical protein